MAVYTYFLFTFLLFITHCRADKLDQIVAKHQSYCGLSIDPPENTNQYNNDTGSTAASNETISMLIVGGSNADRFEFPWQISLRRWSNKLKRWYHTCGGVIIDNWWVLTAAHCTLGSNVTTDQFRVRIGEYDYSKLEGSEIDCNVSKILPHDDFSMLTIEPDINLLKLKDPIPLGAGSKYAPICIGKNDDDDVPQQQQSYQTYGQESNSSDKICISTGWGKLHFKGMFPTVLQKVPVHLVSQDECRNAYQDIANVTDGMICSGQEGKGTCEGDSGGPLQCLERLNTIGNSTENENNSDIRWTLRGLTSWAVGCAEANFPSVAAKVSHYREWIADIITNN